MQLGLGFWGSRALLSAVELGVFTALAAGPASHDDLVTRLALHPRGARDFLDALVSLGVLERDADGYHNTVICDYYLDRAKPSYIGGLLEMAAARLWQAWGGLTDSLRTGRSQSEVRDEADMFAALYADPARLEGFLRAMTGVSLPTARSLAQRFPWERYGSVADLGCAQGGCVVELAKAHAHLRGYGFDLAPVEPIFRAYAAANRVGDRLSFVAGSFFDGPLPPAQVYVMGHILHDWDLAQKRLLLRRAHEALPPGGALIVYDAMIDDDRRSNTFGLLMSLNMLVETAGGFDYTGADCLGWMAEAGFADTYVEPLGGPHAMAVGYK